jgi:hypothetical protein
VVVVVDPRLPRIEVRWWDPFGAAVFALPRGPAALFDQAVVRATGQGQLVDVGFSIGGPAIDVVDLAPVARGGAARTGAAAVERMQNDALPGGGEALGAANRMTSRMGSRLPPAVTATPAADCRSCSVVDTMMVHGNPLCLPNSPDANTEQPIALAECETWHSRLETRNL